MLFVGKKQITFFLKKKKKKKKKSLFHFYPEIVPKETKK
jgi:hypothetical protein